MIGAVIGDIVGSIYEFNNTFDYNFPLFSERCEVTDDTVCTIAVADAILRGIPYKDAMIEWGNRYPHPMGAYGASFGAWLRSRNPQPYDSFGNGAAMRISPVGAAFDTYSDVMRNALEATKISHDHTEGLVGAMAVATVGFFMHKFQHKLLYEKQHYIRTLAYQYYGDNAFDALPPRGRFDETCQGCVPLAFKILTESNSFEDAIRRAVSYGGDSDTLAAIVGGIAEEIFGIPDEIIKKASEFIPADMKAVIKGFYSKYYDKALAEQINEFL